MRANSLMATGENLTEIVGYALAGLTLAYRLYVNRLPYRQRSRSACPRSPWCSCAIRRRRARPRHETSRSFWHELREGLRFLRRHRGLLMNTVMVVASVAGLGASYPLTFLLAVRVLDGGTKAFGTFEAVIAVGYLVGLSRAGRRWPPASPRAMR